MGKPPLLYPSKQSRTLQLLHGLRPCRGAPACTRPGHWPPLSIPHRANEEIAQVRTKAKAESAALHAGLRKEQMKVESLERTLQQKVTHLPHASLPALPAAPLAALSILLMPEVSSGFLVRRCFVGLGFGVFFSLLGVFFVFCGVGLDFFGRMGIAGSACLQRCGLGLGCCRSLQLWGLTGMRRGEPRGPRSAWMHKGAVAGAGVGAGCPFPGRLDNRWAQVLSPTCATMGVPKVCFSSRTRRLRS